MIAHISGRAITFQDCFVVDTPLVIITYHIYSENSYTLSVSSPAGSNIMVSWSECFPTSAVLVTDFGTFFTNDGFITSKEIKFPSNVIDAALIHSVKEVAVFFDHFMILIGGIIYKVQENEITRLGEDMGLPESGIIGIRSRTWCPSEYPELNTLSDLIIWTNDTVYLHSRDYWYILLTNVIILKEALKFQPTADISILKACFDSLPNEISLLIECNGCVSTRVLYLAAVDEQTDKWMLRDFSISASTQGAMNMKVLYSASTSMMLWDDDKVYYTYGGNKINGYLKVSGTDVILSAASEGSTIHQIVIDHYGNTIIKLKNNIMFFLKFEMTDAVKLAAWENEHKNFAFYWIIAGTIYLLSVDGHTINRKTYPLKTEVFSAVFTSEELCPYISFQHSVQSNVYYLDKRQNVTFWTQIVFLENLGLSTEISVYRQDLLKQKTDLHYEIARGICTKNQVNDFSLPLPSLRGSSAALSADFAPRPRRLTEASPEQPLRNSLSHRSSLSTAVRGRTSLPPQRQARQSSGFYSRLEINWKHELELSASCILVKTQPSFPDDLSQWFKEHRDKMKIQYDKRTFGCPIDVYYGDPFRPLVMLYDADTFIDVVESEYVLWEMNGRTDFFYNASMNEAQCLRYAQNWHSMIHKDKDQNLTLEEIDEIWGPHLSLSPSSLFLGFELDSAECGISTWLSQIWHSMIHKDKDQNLTLEEIDEIWGPHNYKSCFKFEHGRFRNMHEPYEILNHSGINSITWPQYYAGIYLFRLRILDPNFSFCDLSALFAVHTYGITESPSGVKVAGFSTLIVTLFLGVLVFSYFRYVTIFRSLLCVDALRPLHPRLRARTSADELKKEE
ncbi:cation channel sperm-associated auxiliary subunit epsilon-like [Heteronotia binoei]|uniref:cation channel sperm-associated auxiliary subunit epsilon-like n=1 Tax=Heteronotia binoei TaxID=13085 RepID=UPI00292E65A4|nr:cation channel sperm-associated auxiliary subunit epsilon-like [Heteronotia binoei]